MKCPNCLTESHSGTKFCPECGYDFQEKVKQQKKAEKERKGNKVFKKMMCGLLLFLMFLIIIGICTSDPEGDLAEKKEKNKVVIAKIDRLVANGSIVKFDVDANEAYILPPFWYSLNAQQKV